MDAGASNLPKTPGEVLADVLKALKDLSLPYT
jgi:hypothetical protein